MAGLSRVRCDLDFDSAGRQAGFLRASLSRNTAGWEMVKISITVAKNGTGPTVLFTSGILRDEYEGQIAIARLACDLDPAQIQNRVIMLPMVNVSAALNDTRLSPVDNWDINRGFPGEPHKTGNIALVVLRHSVSLFDRALYYANGCDPEDFDLIVVKSPSPHTEYKMYCAWVEENSNLDIAGATSANLPPLGHMICARPVFPLDSDVAFHPSPKRYWRTAA